MGFFQDLFGTGGDASKAAQQKAAGLQAGFTQASDYYGQGRGAITDYFGKATDTLTPGYNLGVSGAGAYGDITGANGVPGQDRARALFMTDPGYEFARDEALKATQRASGTGGFQNSGNVATALEDRASGLAQQQYGNYVSRLAPFLGYSLGTGGQLAGVQTGEGTALNASLGNQGNLAFNTQAGIGDATAAGITGDAAQRAAGINNLLKLGGLAVGGASGGFGGLSGIGQAGNTGFLGGAGPIFGGTNPNAWYTG
jgi:hypothetical protein